MTQHKKSSLLIIFLFCIGSLGVSSESFGLKFEQSEKIHAENGQALVKWSDEDGPFKLEKVYFDGRNVTLYEGAENAYFLSGLNQEDFDLVVSSASGLQDRIGVHVTYPEAGDVWLYLTFGILIFVILVTIVTRGYLHFGKRTT